MFIELAKLSIVVKNWCSYRWLIETSLTSITFNQITGANYQGSFFCFVATNLCLTAHRLIYTLLPLKAQHILTATVERVSGTTRLAAVWFSSVIEAIFEFSLESRSPCVVATRIICCLKACMTLIFIFYLSYIGVTLSPLASVIFCPAHFFFYFELRPLYPLLSM